MIAPKMLNRKNRMLALSALILTVIFILITTSTTHESESIIDSASNKNDVIDSMSGHEPTKEELKEKQEVAAKLKDTNNNLNDVVKNPKSGEIDESKVKHAEEIISENKKIGGASPAAAPKKELIQENHVVASEVKAFDPVKEFKQILSVSPVVIFSKTYCPYSKALKSLLKTQYTITPEPAIVELDKHENGAELQAYIGEKSGRKTVPNLFINGVSRGGSDEMRVLHGENKLLESLIEWGEKTINVDKVNAPSNS